MALGCASGAAVNEISVSRTSELTVIVAVTMPNKQASVFRMGIQENETNDIRKPLSLLSLTPQAEVGINMDGTLAGPGLESDLENVAGCRSDSVEEPKQETAGLVGARPPV